MSESNNRPVSVGDLRQNYRVKFRGGLGRVPGGMAPIVVVLGVLILFALVFLMANSSLSGRQEWEMTRTANAVSNQIPPSSATPASTATPTAILTWTPTPTSGLSSDEIAQTQLAVQLTQLWELDQTSTVASMTLATQQPPVPMAVTPFGCATHIVVGGDTLSKIAQRYGADWNKIAFDNNIADPNLIEEGQVLQICK